MINIRLKNSIQNRLLRNFLVVIIVTVILLELFIVIGIRHLTYLNLEQIVTNNSEYAINSIMYKSDTLDITEILDPNLRQYFSNRSAQVQIIDKDSNVIFDSLGVLYNGPIVYPDITTAKNGTKGVWRGKVDYSDETVMAVSTPIVNSINQNIGIMRMIISLDKLHEAIFKMTVAFILVGVGAIATAYLISIYLSRSITKPLKQLNEVAMKIAGGQLKVRSVVNTNDEIEQVSDSINFMAEELVKKEQIKADFISSISHELRTPLTSIKGWAITLQNADLKDQSIKDLGLDIIVGEADRLSDMVEELLDFSRYTSGRIRLNKDNVDVEKFLMEMVDQMKPRILNEGHVLSCDFADGLGEFVVDKNRLKQVFINILDNSIKFMDEPGIVSIFARRNVHKQIVVSIKDTGSGISPEELLRVKDKFYKGKHSKSHTGLGLSISTEIVELHGGELNVDSDNEKGTKITIIIPDENVGGVIN